MNLNSVLSAVAGMDLSEIAKVQKTCETLLQGTGSGSDAKRARVRSRSSWEAMVWEAVNEELQERGLPTRPASVVANGKNGPRFIEACGVLESYLQRVSGETDKLKLRKMLPLLIDAGFRNIQEKGWSFAPQMIINVMPNFPAYLESAYPGISRVPGHFSAILTLYRQHHPSSLRT